MIRLSRRLASLPLIMYFINGVTSINAAALRIAQYSRSKVNSYEPTTIYPAQRRQFCGRHRFEVRSWNGVRLSSNINPFRRDSIYLSICAIMGQLLSEIEHLVPAYSSIQLLLLPFGFLHLLETLAHQVV